LESGYVNSGNLKIYYEIEGIGEPLLMLGGGPGLPLEYLQGMRTLAPYARLIFFDQRGAGRSDPTDPRDYTVEANVEDIENVRRGLHLGKCGVFGHSSGGMLAQAYVLRYPRNVTKLILAHTFPSTDDLNAALATMRDNVPPETRLIYEKYEREGLYKGRDRYPAEYEKAVHVAYEPVFISVPFPKYVKESFERYNYEVYRTMWGEETEFKVTGTLASFNATPRLAEIRIPTLIIVGAKDMTPVPVAERMARSIPKAQLELFEHSHHWSYIEEPEKFLRTVSEFLRTSG
jgi:proline iminopeptidase